MGSMVDDHNFVFEVKRDWPQYRTNGNPTWSPKNLLKSQKYMTARKHEIPYPEEAMSLDGRSSSIMSEEEDDLTPPTTRHPSLHRPTPISTSTNPTASTTVPLHHSPTHRGDVRHRGFVYGGVSSNAPDSEPGYVVIPKPENTVEAQRLVNNYTFGFKKWKGHVTERPLEARSEIVRELYSDTQKISEVSTFRPGNVWYVIMFGWWISLVYLIVALIMTISIVGRHYAKFCLILSTYFFWPFGKFVHCDNLEENEKIPESSPLIERANSFEFSGSMENGSVREEIPLIGRRRIQEATITRKNYWREAQTYVWLILGYPLLVIVHCLAFFISWFLIIFIPIAKINSKTIRKILLMSPELLSVSTTSYSQTHPNADIVMYTHQAVNVYYYKYTVDGMNVIAVNLLMFVIVAMSFGYLDPNHVVTGPSTKFILSLFAIIPLAYYIGMGITSLSAQTNFAVGAVLNASFGSVVEITLYILALLKGKELGTRCYEELVKASLVGTLLATMMLVPGLCMVIGGLKHSTQTFNPHSAGVSSTLLFVSVAGAFAPTIFSKSFGDLSCNNCTNTTVVVPVVINGTNTTQYKWSIQCSDCDYGSAKQDHSSDLYKRHIAPLVYTCAIVLPIAYIIGLVFSLKTHRSQIHDTFMAEVNEESNTSGSSSNHHGHSVAHWGRAKSFFILLVSTVLMSLCADLLTENVEFLLKGSTVTVYFIGVTLFALVPNMPEIINGMQFALQNNICLSIEVGCSIALQVCLLQIPILVLVNLIVPMNFSLVFDDIHLWSVVFAVLMMNYVFQDGKSDYFQGAAVCLVYLALIAMYFFAPATDGSTC